MDPQGLARYVAIGAMVLVVAVSALAYQLNLTSENEKKLRVRAQEIADQAIKAKEMAEAKALEAERRAREAEDRAFMAEMDANKLRQSSQASVSMAAPPSGDYNRALQRDAATRKEASELARLDTLRVQCQGFMNAQPGPVTSIMGYQSCTAYYQALKQRQYYESLRQR
jgi:hypothetical protein